MLSCGDTFLTGDGDEDNYHLWVVITSPIAGEVITVCIVTANKRFERLVELKPGDHPFIKHNSVIGFGFSKIREVGDIEAAFKLGVAKQRESVSPELLAKIRNGLRDSDFTPNGVRHYYETVCLAHAD
jgi:hypothetical protein